VTRVREAHLPEEVSEHFSLKEAPLLILLLHFRFYVFCFRSPSPSSLVFELCKDDPSLFIPSTFSFHSCSVKVFSFTMVVIRECDERGRELGPIDPLEKAKLQRDCLRHVTRQNDIIDWEAYGSSYFGHMSVSDLSSESDSGDYDDSDCVFLYSTSGKEVIAHVIPQMTRAKGVTISEVESDTENFGDDVQSYTSIYCDQAKVNLFRSKNVVSATGREEDIDMMSCPPGEIVCVLRPKGVREIFHMYGVVLEEFGVWIPFTLFQMDVMRFSNVAPTQIRPNSWAFIRGFEILCEALDMIPSAGAFFHFYGTKGVDKGSWVSISAHAGLSLFPSYASNFKKNRQVSFMKVCASKDSRISVASVDGDLRFPLSWTSSPPSVCGYDCKKMTPYEHDVVGFLDWMKLTDIRTLLNKEKDSEDLEL